MDPQALASLAPQRGDAILSRLANGIEIYCVGGAVRDCLLGEPALDRDYLVTGASPEQMVAAGFRPVGRDFPVFLHPVTQAEYALARTERKSGQGYKGFVFFTGPQVSLREDLMRRDLRINAMAVDSQGRLHDPLGGYEDLKRKTLQHISPAFREDPLRLLRLARFCARWPDFSIGPETFALCQAIVTDGELRALVAERIWSELEKGLDAVAPARMMSLLEALKAWPELVGASPASATSEPNPCADEAMVRLTEAKQCKIPTAALAGLLFSTWPAGRLEPVLPKQVLDWRRLLTSGLARPGWLAHIAPTARCEDPAQTAAAIADWADEADLYRRPERIEPLLALADPADRGALALPLIRGLVSLSVGEAAQSAARAHQSVPLAVRSCRLSWLTRQLEGTEH
jgi:tRNA nucleotidyltransferase (CCA-adding enzyme)